MLSKEENELLTRVGPGTPAGAMLRRYWWPVAFSEAVKAKGGAGQSEVVGGRIRVVSRWRGTARTWSRSIVRIAARRWNMAASKTMAFAVVITVGSTTFKAIVWSNLRSPAIALSKNALSIRHIMRTMPPDLIFAYVGPEPVPMLPNYDLLVREDGCRVVGGGRRKLQLAAARRELGGRRAFDRAACGGLSEHGIEAADD